MPNTEAVEHVTIDELKRLVRKEKDKRLHERLLFIRQLYLGDGVVQACDRLCISVQAGYDWLKQWNEGGYEGLGPGFGGGRPPKLTGEQKDGLVQQLKAKANWLSSEVRSLVAKVFGVAYSERHIARLLRGFGMNYAKPYVLDYRKPENAEELLKLSIMDSVVGVSGDVVVGFMDEASPQTRDNRQRVWSFGKPNAKKNTTKYRANTFGFYPIIGKAVVDFKGDSRLGSVREFLRAVRDRNPGKPIMVFLDNYSSHRSLHTRRFAESIGIKLVFLPKYSPDLNPIEFIWKSARRRVSQVGYIASEWSLKETVRTAFCRLARKRSFMSSWLEKFGPCFSSLLCQ